MKEITELYEEILQDEGLKAEFVEAAKDNQMEAFLQKNDCTATPSQLQEFAEKKQSELVSLSDAELDAAAGGGDIEEAFMSISSLGLWCFGAMIGSAIGKGVGGREDIGDGKILCKNDSWHGVVK